MSRKPSFRVVEGGRELHRQPLTPSEEHHQDNRGLWMAGAVVFGWFAMIGVVWTAHAIAKVTGLVR